MRITNKDISKDVNFIISEIKSTEVEIPSFFSCAMPGIALFSALPLWHLFILSNYTIKVDHTFVLFLSSFIGFLSALGIYQIRSKYLSLPKKVRKQSVIIKIIKIKTLFYGACWIISNMTFGVLSIIFLWSPPDFNLPVFLLASMILTWVVALADLGRYDLSLLSAAIQSWREGGDVNLPMSSQHHQQ